MIEKEEIEAIKRDVDLIALIESKGIPLKKNGKGYKGLCPFHEDTNPSLSVNPSTNLWNCFGCDSGGDAIRFVELFNKIGFKEAVEQLTGVTDQALFYKEEDSLVHKILAIEEEGMGGAAYSIRNIQSSKKITVAATGKDSGTGKDADRGIHGQRACVCHDHHHHSSRARRRNRKPVYLPDH